MKLTIILTVFNKEPFLHRVFNSILSQSGVNEEDYEVLVVNDGSTDNSFNIIKDYSLIDTRIRVIDQNNQGLSMARNNGVSNAKGDYIWFVDADDCISTDAVSTLLEAIKFKPDIIPIYAETVGIPEIRNKIPVTVRTGRDILLSKKWNHCGPFFIYKRSFLNDNNLHYLPNIFHEDSELTPRLLWYAKSVVVVPKVLYYVYRDPNSITQKPRKKRAFDYLLVAENLYNFSRKQVSDQDKLLLSVYDSVISVVINNALSIISAYDQEAQMEFNSLLYGKRFLFQSLLKTHAIKYNIEGFLFNILPHKYVNIYKFINFRR